MAIAGKSGGHAAADRLKALLPKRSPKGVLARFRALSKTGPGNTYLDDAGVSKARTTRSGWLRGKNKPSKANERAINDAFERWQADNLNKRITKGGPVTIEIYPSKDVADQSRKGGKAGTGPAAVGQRNITVAPDQVSQMIDAWRRGDQAALDRIWRALVETQIQGSPPARAYFQVDHVWFG